MMSMVDAGNENLSLRDKLKFFEQEITDHAAVGPKKKDENRKFTYLQEHEVAKLKTENERKMSLMSQDDLLKNMQETVTGPADKEYQAMITSLTDESASAAQMAGNGTGDHEYINNEENGEENNTSTTDSSEPIVKTAKSERRHQEKRRRSGDVIQPDSNKDVSPSEERMIKAEKRGEWRRARMKSLEEDAMRAQAVIAKVREMQDPDLNDIPESKSSNGDTQNRLQSDPVFTINTRPGEYIVRERSRVLDEKVTREVEACLDEMTGETTFRTVEFIEKTVEHEVETTNQQIVELHLDNKSNGGS